MLILKMKCFSTTMGRRCAGYSFNITQTLSQGPDSIIGICSRRSKATKAVYEDLGNYHQLHTTKVQ